MVKAIKNIMRERGMSSHLIHVITNEELVRLQQTLLVMVKDVIAACEKINVECTLIGGSVLGAVRHKGFIPWDDDLDIGMSRNDWEIFKDNFYTLLGERYALEAPNFDNKDTKQLLSKIYLKGTDYVMIEEVNFPYHNCIFIDVFVIDYVSNNIFIQNMDAMITNVMRLMAITMQEYKYPSPIMRDAMNSALHTKIYYCLRQVIGMCSSVISHKSLSDFFDHFVSRHKTPTKSATVATGLKRYRKEMLDYNVWFPYSKGQFCDITVNLPHNPDKYLSTIYGNYMQIPPVEKRETHAIVKLRFLDE